MINSRYSRKIIPHLYTTLLLISFAAPSYASEDTISNNSDDWAYYGRDYTNQRFSPLTEINTGNVKKPQNRLAL